MEEFLSKLTPEERTRFESDHLKPAKKSSKTAADAPTSVSVCFHNSDWRYHLS